MDRSLVSPAVAKVEKTGFRTETQQSLGLAINAVSRVDFTLAPGSVSERVEVTARVPEILNRGRKSGMPIAAATGTSRLRARSEK